MRKTPSSDSDRASRPASGAPASDETEQAATPAHEPAAEPAADDPDDDRTAPSLVWPPAEDELNDWEVLQLKSTGHTIIEPMKFVPPAAATPAAAEPATEHRPFVPPTPAPYVPPEPIVEDPVGDTLLV